MAIASLFTGKTLEEAVRKGLEALRISRAEAMITVIEEGSGGFLGLGARPYRVRIMPRPGGAIREVEDRPERDRAGRQGRSERGGRGDRESRAPRARAGERSGSERGGERAAERGGDRASTPVVAAGRDERRGRGEERGPRDRPQEERRGEDRGRDDRRRSEGRSRGEERRGGAPDERRGARPAEPRVAPAVRVASPAPSNPEPMETVADGGDESGRRRRRRGRRGGRGRGGPARLEGAEFTPPIAVQDSLSTAVTLHTHPAEHDERDDDVAYEPRTESRMQPRSEPRIEPRPEPGFGYALDPQALERFRISQ